MRAKTRDRFLTASFALAALTTVVWCFAPGDIVWGPIRLVLAVITLIVFAIWWCSTPTASHKAPDILTERFGAEELFETDGLCFRPALEVDSGICWFQIYYQNRFTGPCCAAIEVIPMEGVSKNADRPHQVPPIMARFDCDTAEVGVASYPYPLAKPWQGKIMIFDLYPDVQYAAGQGEAVRPEVGTYVPRRKNPSQTQEVAGALVTAALLATGHVHLPKEPRGGKFEGPAS